MVKLSDIERTPKKSLDARLLKLCLSVVDKRPRTVIQHILEHGIITNEELKDKYGYDHPPRAIADVRDQGIPLITHRIVSEKSGRRVGAYTFGDAKLIRDGRLGGRTALPKALKDDLITLLGSRDTITGQPMDARYLQIDHRIPYRISHDKPGDFDSSKFMLLEASSNRAKSWSCENCENFKTILKEEVCQTCFWASPEDYSHVAMMECRRLDITWFGDEEVAEYDSLQNTAASKGIALADYIKSILRRS